METIFALASARGKAGVAVVRISGPDAHQVAAEIGAFRGEHQRPALRTLRSRSGQPLDRALVLHFDEGHSFTGEATVELHLHGSVAVVHAVLAEIGAVPGARMAEPGEFTRRALENERLNLAQVEGLADLIDAETEMQRKQALRVFSGELGRKASQWRSELVRAAALLEATIDFADEDVPEDVTPEVVSLLAGVAEDLRTEVAGATVSERIRDGFEVAIVGRPNAGKSTLMNALAGRDVAITSEIAGTTRDVIEVRLDLRGIPVTLLDTAGLRDTDDEIERIGVERAEFRARDADLRVFLLSGDDDSPGMKVENDDLLVIGKGDLYQGERFSVSGVTQDGIPMLIDALTERLERRVAGAGTAIRARQRLAMENALRYVAGGLNEVQAGSGRIEFAAEELHRASRALESMIGQVDVEHLLDEIFSSFCLGK